MEPHDRDAVAALADDVGQALLRYAQALRENDRSADTGTSDVPRGSAPRGAQQKRVLKLRGISAGLTAADVSEKLSLRLSNVYKLLDSLVEAGWLEVVPGEEPTRWRKAEQNTDT